MTARVRVDAGPVLCADSVGKSFRGRRVLTAATLRVFAGEVLALVGRNGAGKSTLLRIAAGDERPDYGTVRFAGETYLVPRLPTLATRGLFLLPDRDILSSAFVVRAQIAAAARFALQRRRTTVPVADAVEAAARELGIATCIDRRPLSLSGGERRRAEVAVALAAAPVCFLADEPYRGLAPMDAEHLAGAFRRLAAAGCAVVVTGHEVDTLFAGADRVLWCTAGTTRELGDPAAAFADFHFGREYLGPRR